MRTCFARHGSTDTHRSGFAALRIPGLTIGHMVKLGLVVSSHSFNLLGWLRFSRAHEWEDANESPRGLAASGRVPLLARP